MNPNERLFRRTVATIFVAALVGAFAVGRAALPASDAVALVAAALYAAFAAGLASNRLVRSAMAVDAAGLDLKGWMRLLAGLSVAAYGAMAAFAVATTWTNRANPIAMVAFFGLLWMIQAYERLPEWAATLAADRSHLKVFQSVLGGKGVPGTTARGFQGHRLGGTGGTGGSARSAGPASASPGVAASPRKPSGSKRPLAPHPLGELLRDPDRFQK